jgi:lysozyme family protein
MASFLNILPHVFKWEGGLVFHGNENQWTNKGIQYTTYKALAKQLLNIAPNEAHFKKLTDTEAGKFIQYYWNKATYNNAIPNQDAANLMFTALWGSGGEGVKDMQRALNAAYKSNLVIDGQTGPATVAAIRTNVKSPEVLYTALENRFKRLATNPTYSKYLKGWLNRLTELKPFLMGGLGLLAFAIGFYLITR